VPACYVDHLAGRDIVNTYKGDAEKLISNIDLIGFRSRYIKNTFEQLYGSEKPSFYCYSGIPEEFLPEKTYKRTFDKVKNFVYVGTLIERKYPAEIIPALYAAYGNDEYSMRYIGRGNEESEIKNQIAKYRIENKVEICGYMPREEVVKNLDRSDVFVMMSRNETFGLVYLEAMARGCITIASWREGFDGIIEDGVNGFLCEAGDSKDLARVIKRIKQMSVTELNKISENAMKTARELTDKKVAMQYLRCMQEIVNNYFS
jgi:glycosyltransferase involved in cell wall biosynthesis